MDLPKKFEERMKELLGQKEWEEYLLSLSEKPYGGIRANTLKITPKQLQSIVPFSLWNIPWTENGFYYEKDKQPAKHPFYYAGLYYIQEPSAMTPAACLPVEPGDRVLDLCAAPGGKSTELAAKLKGEGVLISNDVSASRAMALLKNLELFGVINAVVLSEYPAKLEKIFPNWFDKILVDAPCSGEGMFRKDTSIRKSWEKQGPDYYQNIQKEIIVQAAHMLKPGGKMIYSTCTFSPEENEQVICHLLEQCRDMRVVPISPLQQIKGLDCGRIEWGNGNESVRSCIRLWPHRIKGEGHFIALLQKEGTLQKETECTSIEKTIQSKETEQFLQSLLWTQKKGHYVQKKERLYYVPNDLPNLSGLRILKPGLYIGDIKRNRFEPAQPLANALKSGEFPNEISLSIHDDRVVKYLKGETIEVGETKTNSWHLVLVEGYPIGFGKVSQGILKNKYHTSWRWL